MFHKDEEHRGQHLVDPSNGELWPWTRTLAAKNWALADDKEAFMKRKAKLNVMKLHPNIIPEPEHVVETPEDATTEEAMAIYTKEAKKEKK